MLTGVCCVGFSHLHMLQGSFVVTRTDQLGCFFVGLRSKFQMFSGLHMVLMFCARGSGVVLDVVFGGVLECHSGFQKMNEDRTARHA